MVSIKTFSVKNCSPNDYFFPVQIKTDLALIDLYFSFIGASKFYSLTCSHPSDYNLREITSLSGLNIIYFFKA